MSDNPSLNDSKSIKESLKSGWPVNHPRHKSEMTQKSLKMIQDWIKKDPVMVIDLYTLKLRPPKYK